MYFDGRTAAGTPVELRCDGAWLHLHGAALSLEIPLRRVALSPRLGRSKRQLTFDGGAVCEVEDSAVLDQWFTAGRHRRWNALAALEAHWAAIAASVIVVITLIAAVAVYGLPWAARYAARAMPQAWVGQVGQGALATLDGAMGDTSALPAERQRDLREQFTALSLAAQVDARFEFRSWKKAGPNAFALPDGTIVMTDALVNLAEDDRELLAVIGHELGHLHERHSMQQIIAGSGLAALLFLVTGDVSGMSGIAVAAPTVLMQLRYSRDLEAEADRFGAALLCRQGIDPQYFATIMRKLHDAQRARGAGEPNSWLDTHPDSEERARSTPQGCG